MKEVLELIKGSKRIAYLKKSEAKYISKLVETYGVMTVRIIEIPLDDYRWIFAQNPAYVKRGKK